MSERIEQIERTAVRVTPIGPNKWSRAGSRSSASDSVVIAPADLRWLIEGVRAAETSRRSSCRARIGGGAVINPGIEQACEVMHDAYEAAALGAGWETQEASRKPWSDVPEANKATMRVAVKALLDYADDRMAVIHAMERMLGWMYGVERAPGGMDLFETAHIKAVEEAAELAEDASNIEEWVDTMSCLWAVAARQGWKAAEIVKAFDAKREVNEARTWTQSPDGTWRHSG